MGKWSTTNKLVFDKGAKKKKGAVWIFYKSISGRQVFIRQATLLLLIKIIELIDDPNESVRQMND